jgi:hypothetical protein
MCLNSSVCGCCELFALIQDLVYYQTRALKIDTLRGILGSLVFIERRALRGAGQMERLLRDYHMAQEEIRLLKLSVLKVGSFSQASSIDLMQHPLNAGHHVSCCIQPIFAVSTARVVRRIHGVCRVSSYDVCSWIVFIIRRTCEH